MKWYKSIRTRMFSSVLLLIATLLILVYLLQIFLLPSFYKNHILSQVQLVAKQMNLPLTSIVEGENFDESFQVIQEYTQRNHLCVYVFDEQALLKLEVNSMGSSCYLNYLIRPNVSSNRFPSLIMHQYIEMLEKQPKHWYYFMVRPNEQIVSQVFFAQKTEIQDKAFYIFVNAPFELLASTIGVLNFQFFFISMGVLLIGMLIAFLIVNQISKPLRNFSQSASKLAQGHEDVHFELSNVTELDELAKTLNFATAEIKKTDNLRNDLLANISHDIKTPLTMISAYAQLIQDVSHNNVEKMNEHLNIIIDEVDQLNLLLNDMMTLSQVQSNTSRELFTTFDLNQQVANIVESFKQKASLEQVHIQVIGKLNHQVYGDEIKIRQVITNYLANALKFVGDDKVIVVKIIEIDETGYGRIEVEDHGVGIDEENQPCIWERYYKVNSHFSRSKSGSGLGLAISKAICEQGNYPYGVLSQPGKKTIFFIEIPLDKK